MVAIRVPIFKLLIRLDPDKDPRRERESNKDLLLSSQRKPAPVQVRHEDERTWMTETAAVNTKASEMCSVGLHVSQSCP